MTNLQIEIKDIVSNGIHARKCKTKLSKKDWMILDSDEMSEEIVDKITKMLEAYLYLPCCHVTGMHDPQHFDERKYICPEQKENAFIRFCKDLGVNPIVRSKIDCGWCGDYPSKRRGEGLQLFENPQLAEGEVNE